MVQNGQMVDAAEFARSALDKEHGLKESADAAKAWLVIQEFDAFSFKNAPAPSQQTVNNIERMLQRGEDVMRIAGLLAQRQEVGGIKYLLETLPFLKFENEAIRQETARAIQAQARPLMDDHQVSAWEEMREVAGAYGPSVESNYKKSVDFWQQASEVGHRPKPPSDFTDWAQIVSESVSHLKPDEQAQWTFANGTSILPLAVGGE